MHIAEGVLSAPVLAAGAVLAAGGLAIGLKRMREDQVLLAGVLAAAFFVASLIHVPIGFSSAHLVLCGLLGVLLGWAAIPAIFVALLLQGLLFQYGGLTTLGVNTCTMGFGAVLSWYLFRAVHALFPQKWGLGAAAFCGGFCGVFFSAFFTALALAFSDEGFRVAAAMLFAAHLPIMLVEGLITLFTVGVITRVRPKIIAESTHMFMGSRA